MSESTIPELEEWLRDALGRREFTAAEIHNGNLSGREASERIEYASSEVCKLGRVIEKAKAGEYETKLIQLIPPCDLIFTSY